MYSGLLKFTKILELITFFNIPKSVFNFWYKKENWKSKMTVCKTLRYALFGACYLQFDQNSNVANFQTFSTSRPELVYRRHENRYNQIIFPSITFNFSQRVLKWNPRRYAKTAVLGTAVIELFKIVEYKGSNALALIRSGRANIHSTRRSAERRWYHLRSDWYVVCVACNLANPYSITFRAAGQTNGRIRLKFGGPIAMMGGLNPLG